MSLTSDQRYALEECGDCTHHRDDHREAPDGTRIGCRFCACEHGPREALQTAVERILARAQDDGVRQAIEWLRAGYEYGTGPDWRERGAEWIAERAAEERLTRQEARQ
jgi:hypothetical protein